jgi:hypothetical protein
MKPLFLTLSLIPLIAIGACSQSGVTPTPGTGGTTGSGGSTGTGGSGTGGSIVGTGGTTGTGGATTGSGGDTTGSGGTTATGGTVGGGGTGVAGTTGGIGGSGRGGAGAGAGGASTEVVTPASIAGIANANGARLMDSFILFPCLSPALQDCITSNACPPLNTALPYEQQGLITQEVFQLGGTPGKMYNLTVRVNGISEAKYYMGGTRAAGNAAPANPDAVNGTDTFYTGGQPVNFENYNVYKFIVKNAAGVELQHYYLNSFPMVATPYENHQTFPVAFTHDIPVPGGGTVTYYTADRNCHAIDNCGIGFRAVSCAVSDGRMVPNEPNLTIPTMYMGKSVASMNTRNGAAQPFHSQIFHIVVTGVAAM